MRTDFYVPTWADTRAAQQARHEQRKRANQPMDRIVQDYNHRRQQAARLVIRSYGDE